MLIHKVPFLDLRVSDDKERKELLAAIEKVLLHGPMLLGPEVQELETKVAADCGRKYAVGVNSGTDALFLGLKSLGIGLGDEVITTSLSWIATANAIALTGATPVFADICEDLNIDPDSIKRLITSRTKAIMPVHYTGKVCKMTEIIEIAKKHGLLIIEDAAQAYGATHFGHKAGSFGDVACFSMNPMKVFAACGEAGMVLTDNKDIYDRLISLRYNGTVNREICIEPCLNARIDTIQAAILLKRYDHLEELINRRRKIAACYANKLIDIVEIPLEKDGEKDVYYTYTIRTEKRDMLKLFLEDRGIETKIHHPVLMPEQPAYRNHVKGEYYKAAIYVKQILSIPASEKIRQEDLEYISDCIRGFFRKSV